MASHSEYSYSSTASGVHVSAHRHPPARGALALGLSAMAISLSCCLPASAAFQPLRSSAAIYDCSRPGALKRASGVPVCSEIPVPAARRQAGGALRAVSKRQVEVLDGAELRSVESFLAAEDGSTEGPIRGGPAGDRLGFLTVLVGTVEGDGDRAGRRVVGVEMAGTNQNTNTNGDGGAEFESSTTSLGDGAVLHPDSVAAIPAGVSDADAAATMMAALAAVHCALPISEDVGGSTDAAVGGRAVVVGGGEYATFAADALATLGAEVYQISTGRPKPSNANGELN